MKPLKTILLTSAVLAIASCGTIASTYSFVVDTAQPGTAGIDLANRSIAIVYLDAGNDVDSLYGNALAGELAAKLDGALFAGKASVGTYKMDKYPSGEYWRKDTLVSLVTSLDADVVCLAETPLISTGDSKCISKLYVFDSMNRNGDKVYNIQNDPEPVGESVESLGRRSADSFYTVLEPDWNTEIFSFYYYQSQDWYSALDYAQNWQWSKAVEIWTDLLQKTGNYERKACAAYDIATAFYFTGDKTLATEWLDASDKYSKKPLSDGLRKRIAKL